MVRRKVLGIGYRYEEWRVGLVPALEKREQVQKVENEMGGRYFLWWNTVCLCGWKEERNVHEK